jgi:ElaB/YqjD/DUF883 family membrane-anchored ribosome-binding protein
MNTSTTFNELQNTASDVADKAKDTAGKVASEVKSSGSVIGNEVQNFLSDLEQMVSSKTSGGVELGKIKSDLAAKLADYKASAQAAGQQVVDQAKQKVEGVNSYVHEEPWKAIGVGFAVGLLLGVVISRR